MLSTLWELQLWGFRAQRASSCVSVRIEPLAASLVIIGSPQSNSTTLL